MEAKPIMGTTLNVDAVAYVEAALVGEPDVDAENHQLHPLQSTVGPTETLHTGAKNAHTLSKYTRRM